MKKITFLGGNVFSRSKRLFSQLLSNRRNIVVFGNCQAGQLARLLSELLPSCKFEVSYLSNNKRTGNMKSDKEIISYISCCDVLVYQPMASSHGVLSEESIKKCVKKKCISISFPYLFNSGAYSLCHAPMMAGKYNYGVIFGEEIILDLLKRGEKKEDILCKYKNGLLDFNLKERFKRCLDELKSRELSIDIKISTFILNNYRKEKLFITHNHPANIMFYEIIHQIIDIASLPIKRSEVCNLKLNDLPETNCPITPYDIKTHGYQFSAHKDWFAKGTLLIELIAANYFAEKTDSANATKLRDEVRS